MNAILIVVAVVLWVLGLLVYCPVGRRDYLKRLGKFAYEDEHSDSKLVTWYFDNVWFAIIVSGLLKTGGFAMLCVVAVRAFAVTLK